MQKSKKTNACSHPSMIYESTAHPECLTNFKLSHTIVCRYCLYKSWIYRCIWLSAAIWEAIGWIYQEIKVVICIMQRNHSLSNLHMYGLYIRMLTDHTLSRKIKPMLIWKLEPSRNSGYAGKLLNHLFDQLY